MMIHKTNIILFNLLTDKFSSGHALRERADTHISIYNEFERASVSSGKWGSEIGNVTHVLIEGKHDDDLEDITVDDF